MGEIADDILEGFQCSWCGVCFEQEHGYPVVCTSCWVDAQKKCHREGKKYEGPDEATEKELSGPEPVFDDCPKCGGGANCYHVAQK